MGKKRSVEDLSPIGWREWVSFPELGIKRIKAKVDTGARTSSIHAFEPYRFLRRGKSWVRFGVHPHQRSKKGAQLVEARLIDQRSIRSSSGEKQKRLVISTEVEIMDECYDIEMTLASRDVMGFRLLLGRQAIRDKFLVNPGASYYGGK